MQVGGEGAKLIYLIRRRFVVETSSDEKRLSPAPHQHRQAMIRHQPGRSNIAEAIFFAFHQRDKSVTLEEEMRAEFSGNELDAGGRDLFQAGDHIL